MSKETSKSNPNAPTLRERMALKFRQLMCWLAGRGSHQFVTMHFSHRHMSLRCICGYESPGWFVDRPRTDTHKVSEADKVIHMPLVGERRIA